MSGAGAMAGRAEDQSERDSDIGWFLARAQQAAKGIEDPWGKATAYAHIAIAHVAAGNKAAFWEAVELAQTAAAAVEPAWAGASVSYTLHEFIAEGQVRTGNVASAMSMAGAIEDPVGKARAYCTIAHAQGMAGNQAAAREAIELAEQAAAKAPSGASDAAYMSIAYAQASVGDAAAALTTVGRMVHLQFAALCQIAYAHAEAGNTGACEEAIELAKQAAAVFEEPPLKAWASAMITHAQDHAGDFAGAMETAAGIDEPSSKANAYGEIAQAQARTGGVEAVKGWIEKLTEPSEVVKACLGAVRGLLGEED